MAGQWDSKIKKVTEPLRKNTLQSGERVVKVDEALGKPSETRFKILQRYEEGTLVEAFLSQAVLTKFVCIPPVKVMPLPVMINTVITNLPHKCRSWV